MRNKEKDEEIKQIAQNEIHLERLQKLKECLPSSNSQSFTSDSDEYRDK
jgi:hypothetical protein